MTSAADRRVYWVAVVVTLVLDQVTKFLAEASLPRFTGVPVVGDWFQLRLVYNQGAAFGFLLLIVLLLVIPQFFPRANVVEKIVGPPTYWIIRALLPNSVT